MVQTVSPPPAVKQAPPDADAARVIYQSLMRLMAFLHQGYTPRDAWRGLHKEPSFPQFKTLMMLRHEGPTGIKNLAGALGTSAASVSEMIDRLVEAGLVDRRQDPIDRRRVVVSLTRQALKGVTRHEKLITRRVETLMDAIGSESAAKWAEVSRELARIFNES